MPALTLLEQRQIEAGVLVPIIKAFREAFGVDRTNEVVRAVITELARRRGREIAESCSGSPLEKLRATVPHWQQAGALELEVIRESSAELDFNVTRCRYAEFYQELGVSELGYLLSCNRDFALSDGISDDLELSRTQTIMEGADHCDFRFRLKRSS